MVDQLRLMLFGGLQITLGGSRVTDFTSKKSPALLSYLAVTGRPHSREALSGLLWGESPDERARASLRTALWDLRQRVAPYLSIDRQRVGLDQDAPHWVDVAAFSQGIEAALPEIATETWTVGGRAVLNPDQVEALQTAVSLYRGDLLAGFYISEAPAFEDWVLKKREWARHLAIQALHRLIGHHVAQGTYATGIDTATHLLEIAPWKEEAHRQLMTLLALSGQRSAALAQYETCRRMLAEELGVEPTAETQLLYQRIQSGDRLPGEEDGGPLPQPPDRSAVLGQPPSPSSPLVGRQAELDRLTQTLADPEHRLVSLSGPAGIGKTRLAWEAAERLAEDFEHGVCFVSLAEPGSIPPCPGPVWGSQKLASRASFRLAMAIARALGTTFSARTPPMVQLLDYLRHRTMLLVLDDVDDDPALRRAIVELYQRALYLTLLVIADRPLEVEEILNLPLEGLPVPPSSSRPAPEDLMAYDSVALFVERAQEANEGFQLGAGNGRDVIRLCRALNGTPLGIELAAAWAGPRSLSALAHGIQRSLNRVAGDASEIQAPPTLRAAFAYAWQQLPPPMRRKLAELTVFQHDFDQAAAAAVTGSTAGDLDVLVDSALLSRPATGQYTWHAGLWRLARRRLSTPSHAGPVSMLAAGEVDPAADPSTLRRRHAAHYLGLLAERGQAICGEHPQPPASQIRQVWRNVRQAWCWAVQQRQADLLAPPVEALSCYLHLRGPLWEGEELFGMAAYALAEAAEEDPEAAALLTRLLVEEARFVNGQARYGRAAQIAERVIDLARAQRTADGDAAARLALEAAGHRERGKALRSQGDHAAARDELEQALRQGAESDAHGVMASSWHHLGLLALEEERHEEAQEAFQRALQLYRDLGHRRGEANLINELGALALQQRRYPAAQSQLKDALRLHQAIGDRRGESAAQNNLARLADAQGDYELANAYGQRAVCTARDVGDQQGEAQALATLGLLCLHEGKNETAWNRSLQAVELARALGDRAREGRALVILGHAFMELEMLDQAAAAYQQALGLQRALGQSDLAAESLAGLARASLDRNDLAQAQSYVETIWEKLENGDLHGANEPLRVYLTCYQVLRETGDPRANTVLTTASGMFDDLA